MAKQRHDIGNQKKHKRGQLAEARNTVNPATYAANLVKRGLAGPQILGPRPGGRKS